MCETDIVFVILNYNIVAETIQCIESIKNNIDTSSYMIVCIDNASPNMAGEKLKDKYVNDNDVEVVILENNIGFARGNNEGLKKAQNYNPKFIVCMNNDMVFIQKNFWKKLSQLDLIDNIAVIGPKIITKYGVLQGVKKALKPLSEYKDELLFHSSIIAKGEFKKNTESESRMIIKKVFPLVNKIRLLIRTKTRTFLAIHKNEPEIKNAILHGSFLIFTRNWVDQGGQFDERTFLYKEEELLYIKVKKSGFDTLYCPDLYIIHLEDVSTDESFKNDKRVRTSLYKTESLNVLIEEMENFVDEK